MRDRFSWLTARSISLAFAALGLVGVLVTGGVLVNDWTAHQAWLASDDRQRLEEQLAAHLPEPAEREVSGVADAATGRGEPVLRPTPNALPWTSLPPLTASRPQQRVVTEQPSVSPTATAPRPRLTSGVSSLEVLQATILLPELPRPGGPAVLAVTIKNHATEPSGPISIGVSADWFHHYSIIGGIPSVLDDQTRDDGFRYFQFADAAPGAEVRLELHVTAEGETARTPTLKVPMYRRMALGDMRPTFELGDFSLGLVKGLSVPRLGIRTGVVGTTWEPPSFVAGQINTTAGLGEGNSVLIGHRGGNAGNVFLPLIAARLGDEVVAASHGVEQRYIVSEIRTLPGSDSTPIAATDSPRLTLMTCTGAWNPLTGDYSHRLWVIAEPPALARTTLAATVERANQTAASAANRSEALKARTDAALARAALTILDARAGRTR